MNLTAYSKGYRAFRKGKRDNPYDVKLWPEHHWSWQAGYNDAKSFWE